MVESGSVALGMVEVALCSAKCGQVPRCDGIVPVLSSKVLHGPVVVLWRDVWCSPVAVRS